MMNLKFKMDKLLTNKMVLNVIAVISFLNIIGFIVLNNTPAIIYFILIGLLTSIFSKNMIVILLVPLILVNLLVANSNSFNNLMKMNLFNREGMENKDEAKDKNKEKSNKKSSTTTPNTTNTSQGLPMTMTPLDQNTNSNMDSNSNGDSNMEKATGSHDEIDESFEVGRSKKNAKGYNIDYASTIEDAYDELNKILGSDGIKRLTSDTQNLMKQQLQLAESMKSMQPLISGMAPLMKQAQGLLGSMGDNNNLNNLADMAKKFSASLSTSKNP